MNDSYHYLQVEGKQKIIIGFRNKSIMNHWHEKINLGINYCQDSLHITKKINTENQLIENLNDEENIIQLHKRKKKTGGKVFMFDFNVKKEE